LKKGASINPILKLDVRDKIARIKFEPEEEVSRYVMEITRQTADEIRAITGETND
jgi:hypothetical protein